MHVSSPMVDLLLPATICDHGAAWKPHCGDAPLDRPGPDRL